MQFLPSPFPSVFRCLRLVHHSNRWVICSLFSSSLPAHLLSPRSPAVSLMLSPMYHFPSVPYALLLVESPPPYYAFPFLVPIFPSFVFCLFVFLLLKRLLSFRFMSLSSYPLLSSHLLSHCFSPQNLLCTSMTVVRNENCFHQVLRVVIVRDYDNGFVQINIFLARTNGHSTIVKFSQIMLIFLQCG